MIRNPDSRFQMISFILLENTYRQNQVEIVIALLRNNHTGADAGIEFHAQLLIRNIPDHIRNVPDTELCMKFNSSVSPCVVVPQKGDDYLYLILPVRVFQ